MVLNIKELQDGIQLSIKGFEVALNTPKTQRYFYKSFIFLALSMTLIYLLIRSLVFTPLYIISVLVHLINLLIGANLYRFDQWVDSTLVFLNESLIGLPLSLLFLVRYVYPYPMNNIFLNTLKLFNSSVYEELNNLEYQLNYWDEIQFALKRSFKRMFTLILIHLLSKLPIVGRLVLPLATLQLTIKVFGPKLSIPLSILPLISNQFQIPIFWLIKTYFGTRSLARELVEPYFGRKGFDAKNRRKFFKGKESVWLGFGLVFYLLMQIPVIGPVFYVIAQSAVVVLLVEVIEKENSKNENSLNNKLN